MDANGMNQSGQAWTPKDRKMSKFNDYCFFKAIEGINEQRLYEGDGPVMVSRARRLRSMAEQWLVENRGKNFTNALGSELRQAINEVTRDDFYGEDFFQGDDGKSAYNRYFSEFMSYTGFSDKNGRSAVNSPEKLPESPYDPENTYMEVFMKNGGSLLFSDANELMYQNYTKTYYGRDNMGERYRIVGSGPSDSDRSGMARLMPFIPQKDYATFAKWVNDDPQKRYMGENAINRSVAILQYLQDEGYEFEIKKDRNPGQLTANVKGTAVSIRIADTANNDAYVGSVYDDGRRVYFATTPTQDKKPFVITPEDSVNLVKFVLGHEVQRKDMRRNVGQAGVYQSGMYTRPNSYVTDRAGFSAVYKTIQVNGRDSFDKVTIHMDNNRQFDGVRFGNPADAEQYLRDSVDSARNSFIGLIEVDRLVQESNEHYGDDAYVPELSGDPGIAGIQRAYWDVLSGKRSDLLSVGTMVKDYEEAMDTLSEAGMGDGALADFMLDGMVYRGTPEEKVRAHMLDLVDNCVGSYDKGADGLRFDPVKVSQYMVSGSGIYRNNDNLVEAMRVVDMDAAELRGSEYTNRQVRNKLIKFNEQKARPMAESANPFVQDMFKTIKQTLSETGCFVEDRAILMDDQGVVRYTGTRTKNWKNPVQEPIVGEIGQIFVPDDLGMVETKFAGGQNYIFVPGYNATVVPNRDGENKTLEERTRLHGYQQEMRRSLAYQLRSDLMSSGNQFGTPTSVNSVHHRMYDVRYPIDVMQQAMDVDGMRRDVFEANIRTLARRVRYGNEFKDGSTINAAFQAMRGGVKDPANDNYSDPYTLSGGRNMSVMTDEGDGYYDPIATATSVNQGIVRFLTESAQVAEDGSIIRGESGDKTPLMKIPEMEYAEYSPFDRQQMVFSNLMTARAIANDVHMAQMTFGGWGFDDGYVVSKEFAQKYQIRDTEGNLRDMVKGDKICDFGGNKGVISLVVDREMHSDVIASELSIVSNANGKGIARYRDNEYEFMYTDYSEQTVEKQAALAVQKALGFHECDTAIEWFRANPELEVVGAPFPAVSRFNATSDKMLMEHPQDLYAPDGTCHEGCMATTSFIITDMPVDEKTHSYGEEEFAEGKGRKASSQFAWVMASQGATAVMEELYGSNSGALSNLREYCISMGLDIDECGNLRMGYAPHGGEKRQVLKLPELQYRHTSAGDRLDMTRMRREFANVIQNNGGIMELPFALEMPTGLLTPPLNEDKDGVVYVDYGRNPGYVGEDGNAVQEGNIDPSEVGSPCEGRWGLPVLSAYLRSGQEFEDGTVSRHDYTVNYSAIYEAAIKYIDEQNKGEAADQKLLDQYKADAQRNYNQVTSDIQSRKLDGNKHNVFKDEIMSNRMPHSATTVWTADPRLELDEVAFGPEVAEALGVKDGDMCLIWRDPLLRDGGAKYMRVVIDPTLHGCAINPDMDREFDGDFDGDANGAKKLDTRAGKAEAMRVLYVGANMLDYGSPAKDGKGYDLMLQKGLDLASAYYARPELKVQREELNERINNIEADETLSVKERDTLRQQALRDLSSHVKDAFRHEWGTNMISYKNDEEHMKSVEKCVTVGAKGSYSKLKDYMVYMGYSAEMIMGEDGKPCGIDYSTFRNEGHTLATAQNHQDSMYAQACKSFGTGVAGKYSQRGIAALRNICAKAVLEGTYVNTQGMLQAKHDPKDARHRYDMLMTCTRDLWRGFKLERDVDNEGNVIWTTVREKGKAVPATKEEFISQFKDVYGKDGLDVPVNDNYVQAVADGLCDKNTGVMLNLEKDPIPGASPLDVITYGGGFKAMTQMARDNRNLFEGRYIRCMAPSTIRKNWEAVADGRLSDVKGFVKSDVKQLSSQRVRSSDQAVAVGSVARKKVAVPSGYTEDGEPEAPVMDGDGPEFG